MSRPASGESMIEQSKLEAGRLTLVQAPPRAAGQSFSEAVIEGLSKLQKTLPSRFLYDQRGSVLFEQITGLPEYYLTRCEQTLLDGNAREMVRALGPHLEIVEFGSGSSKKTRRLIEAAIEHQGHLDYTAIDISAEFGRRSAERLLSEYSALDVTAIEAEYFEGLAMLMPAAAPRLFLFLGSNIGNFEDSDAIQFLAEIRRTMRPEDGLLMGVDLDKDPAVIEAAYNDSQGITSEFNKNLLLRINRELSGNFIPERFIHSAPYLPERGRVEMRLTSAAEQEVSVGQHRFQFNNGEYIHTENSRKYKESQFSALVAKAGLGIEDCWIEKKGWFGEFLLRAKDGGLSGDPRAGAFVS